MKRDKIFLQYFFCSGAWTIIRNKFIVSNTFFKYKITKQNKILLFRTEVIRILIEIKK